MREAKRLHATIVKVLVAGALIAVAVTPVFATPARACSCAAPSDLQSWVDESKAAFVGTLLEKHSDNLGTEAVYVFEVEEWVKGDLGGVIEVHSASDGAACGFEFWDPDRRLGAIIHEQNGELHGGLCDQVDPDVLLAVLHGPTPSTTGIGQLLVGHGWSTARLSILDDNGGLVADIKPPGAKAEWDGTQGLEVCPGDDLMIQWTGTQVVVWDLVTLQPIANHEVTGDDGYPVIRDASCRSADASSIWVAAAHAFEAELFDLGDDSKPRLELERHEFSIGSDFVITQPHHEGDAAWVDVPSGHETFLTETPPGKLRAISAATHPTERLVAIVETDFNEGGPVEATLSFVDETGTRLEEFIIPWETYSPTWLDETRVAVKVHDFDNWEQSFGFVFDLSTGEGFEVEGWDADHTVADGNRLYGVNGGTIVTTDLSARTVETLVTLASQSAGPIVLLDDTQPVAAPTTVVAVPEEPGPPTTIPPLVAPEMGLEVAGTADAIRWIGGGSILGFLALLVWLARRPGSHIDDET